MDSERFLAAACELLAVRSTADRPAGPPRVFRTAELSLFMPRAADSGTHRGPLAESGTRVLSEDVPDCTGARCTVQYPPSPSFSSGKLSGGRARLSGRR